MRTRALGRTISSRDRRAARVGLLVVASALTHVFVIRPYVVTTRALRDEVRGRYALMAREEDVLATGSATRADPRLAEIAMGRAAARSYAAADTALAMAALGRDVMTALQDAGLTVQRVEMRDSVARRSGVQELTVDIRAQGDFEAILDALARLERNTRLLDVSRLGIDKAVGGVPATTDSLSFVAVVHGYAK